MKKNTLFLLKVIHIVAIISLAIWGIYLLIKGKALCLAIISGSLGFISPLIKNRTIRILFSIVAVAIIVSLTWMAIKGYLTYH